MALTGLCKWTFHPAVCHAANKRTRLPWSIGHFGVLLFLLLRRGATFFFLFFFFFKEELAGDAILCFYMLLSWNGPEGFKQNPGEVQRF